MLSALTGDMLAPIIAAITIILGLIGKGALDRRKGRQQERQRQEQKDRENAKAIRSRVRDANSKPVQPSTIEYRD